MPAGATVGSAAELLDGVLPLSACECPPYAKWARLNVSAADGTFAAIPVAIHHKNDIVSQHIEKFGVWERKLVEVLLAAAAPRGTIIDIGANLGAITISLAAAGRDVLAIEPMSMNREMLKASVCRNPALARRVTVAAVALGTAEQSGTECLLFSTIGNRGNNNLECGPNKTAPTGWRLRGVVPMRTLEQVHQEAGAPAIAALKIDVEGFECSALSGMPDLIHRVPALLSEVTHPASAKCIEELAVEGGYTSTPVDSSEPGGGEMLLQKSL